MVGKNGNKLRISRTAAAEKVIWRFFSGESVRVHQEDIESRSEQPVREAGGEEQKSGGEEQKAGEEKQKEGEEKQKAGREKQKAGGRSRKAERGKRRKQLPRKYCAPKLRVVVCFMGLNKWVLLARENP